MSRVSGDDDGPVVITETPAMREHRASCENAELFVDAANRVRCLTCATTVRSLHDSDPVIEVLRPPGD